jgi:predicted metal-dependent hydrolase
LTDPSSTAGTARPRGATIVQTGGRAKAYRPLADDARRAAFESAIAAYERGDFFEAHELLEPAWMGSADLAERDLDQGLIKLAAAFVHGVRGNPRGIERNLVGARERLAAAVGSPAELGSGLDVSALVAAIDERLGRLAAAPDDATIEPPALTRRNR